MTVSFYNSLSGVQRAAIDAKGPAASRWDTDEQKRILRSAGLSTISPAEGVVTERPELVVLAIAEPQSNVTRTLGVERSPRMAVTPAPNPALGLAAVPAFGFILRAISFNMTRAGLPAGAGLIGRGLSLLKRTLPFMIFDIIDDNVIDEFVTAGGNRNHLQEVYNDIKTMMDDGTIVNDPAYVGRDGQTRQHRFFIYNLEDDKGWFTSYHANRKSVEKQKADMIKPATRVTTASRTTRR